MEEIANEGVLDIKGDPLQGEPDEETIVTGPDGKWDTESRDLARLEDAIRFLVANGREELAEPLKDIQRDLENMGYASNFKDHDPYPDED